jgi:hypothetical protein
MMKNISKAYDACLRTGPRDEKFKQLLNLGTWEAKVALTRFLLEKPDDSLSPAEKDILENMFREGIPSEL